MNKNLKILIDALVVDTQAQHLIYLNNKATDIDQEQAVIKLANDSYKIISILCPEYYHELTDEEDEKLEKRAQVQAEEYFKKKNNIQGGQGGTEHRGEVHMALHTIILSAARFTITLSYDTPLTN